MGDGYTTGSLGFFHQAMGLQQDAAWQQQQQITNGYTYNPWATAYTTASTDTITVKASMFPSESYRAPSRKPENEAWLDARIDEMRVKL